MILVHIYMYLPYHVSEFVHAMKDWGPWLTTGFWDALFLFKQLLGISGIRDDTSSSDLLESITLRWFPRLFFDPRCAIPHHVSTIQKSLTAILEHVHHKYTALRQVDGVGIVKIRQVGRATQHRTTWLISAYLVYTAYIYIQNVAKSSICIWCVCLLIYIYTLYIYYISSSPNKDAESPSSIWYCFNRNVPQAWGSKSRRPGEHGNRHVALTANMGI